MAASLRPRLDRLQELSKQVNAATDDASRIVQTVETYLTDVVHLGVRGSVILEEHDEGNQAFYMKKELVYDRFRSKFRIFVTHFVGIDGCVDTDEATLWANCSRETRLLAFNRLPDLLDQLIKSMEGTLDMVTANAATIQALIS